MAKHEQFSCEHAEAMERSRLYDQDMLDKTRKIKEQAIELKTLENLLHEKTKEMSDQLSDLDLKQKELTKAKEHMNNFEDVISAKQAEIESLQKIISESSEHSIMVELKNSNEVYFHYFPAMLESQFQVECSGILGVALRNSS